MEENADSHDFLRRARRTENADSHDFLRESNQVINVHRDDYAITAVAVRFAGSIKELETI